VNVEARQHAGETPAGLVHAQEIGHRVA
jgi:hypothetical protein